MQLRVRAKPTMMQRLTDQDKNMEGISEGQDRHLRLLMWISLEGKIDLLHRAVLPSASQSLLLPAKSGVVGLRGFNGPGSG